MKNRVTFSIARDTYREGMKGRTAEGRKGGTERQKGNSDFVYFKTLRVWKIIIILLKIC